MKIRKFQEADLAQAMDIEQVAFTNPWSEQSMKMFLLPQVLALAAEDDKGQLAGYGALMIASDEADLVNLAVRPDVRRQGIAKKILRELLGQAKERNVSEIFLELRRANLPAQSLYQSFGFQTVGEIRDYYEQPREDALLMRLTL
ncbi:MAG: ribosomal protein S18-alanine N-acetyltransferase [Clostridia bacterium]|nr:ribosomal protein S18-alanine N-acetyltransferase [Clostridia bacterium]